MTPEGRVKEEVKKLLKKFGIYYFMPVQTGMGKPGLDFYCCHEGRFFAIETKAKGKKLTDRQQLTAAEIRAAGGVVFEIIGDVGFEDLREWLELPWLAGLNP